MELDKIKSCAKESILYDKFKKPIYPGIPCLYVSDTNTICIGTVEKIYKHGNMVKIHEINKRKQLKSILNGQAFFDDKELFARELNLKSKLEEEKEEEKQRIRFKCISGYFQDKSFRGLFYLQINSNPGKYVTNKDIKETISKFKSAYKNLSIRIFTDDGGESTNIEDAKIYSESDYLSEMFCSKICMYDYINKKPYLTEIKDLKDQNVYLIPYLKIDEFKKLFPNEKVNRQNDQFYHAYRSVANNTYYYPYSYIEK